ncbi:putative Zn-ribbon and HTH transcriptional regulator [Salinibacter ruber]|uniref:zinc ribbon domain-containing protein n=1 Tax=Salinibacter ruber TaxID=146919 RepID=UPI00216807BF|nr:zinc ribbon domain-containing protein [Salinibacter ruber]MCS3648827.1 putative Zn-ribbon and HTH transcriptional regulator [Salinibacter ruber]MCS3652081.1 putative Zn-ribbon and HTH transcriptional regulator [Salinibacter ruber]
MITGLLFVQAVVFGILSAIIASNKNRSAGGWGALGFLFGLFGFIAAIAVGEVEDDTRSSRRRSSQQKSSSSERKQTPRSKEKQSASQTFDPDEHEKKCPMCAEYIKLEARRCKHCGHEFSDEEVERQIEERKSELQDGKQTEEDSETQEVDTEDLSKGMRYILNTHDFGEDSDECGKCGVSKSYVVKHQYKCRYSES